MNHYQQTQFSTTDLHDVRLNYVCGDVLHDNNIKPYKCIGTFDEKDDVTIKYVCNDRMKKRMHLSILLLYCVDCGRKKKSPLSAFLLNIIIPRR